MHLGIPIWEIILLALLFISIFITIVTISVIAIRKYSNKDNGL